MSTINGKPFSTPRNVNLKGGILLFGATQTSNPVDSTHTGLYVNSSNQLVFSSLERKNVLNRHLSGNGW